MIKPELQLTADGSHTLYIPELDEHYHSVNGAVQESKHVYIGTAFNCCKKEEIHVLELGFGTGLNTLLTVLEARKRGVKLHYTTLEKYPLAIETIRELNYSGLADSLFEIIHAADWNKDVFVDNHFILNKLRVDFNDFLYPGNYDVVYYDAFAPEKQQEVWNEFIFEKLYSSMNKGGILSTYCAKGNIRRMMQTAGFTVNRLPGPPGKREILQAIKD